MNMTCTQWNKTHIWADSRGLAHYMANSLLTLVIGIPGVEAFVDLKNTPRSAFVTLTFERLLFLLFSFIARGSFLLKSQKTFKSVFRWNGLRETKHHGMCNQKVKTVEV